MELLFVELSLLHIKRKYYETILKNLFVKHQLILQIDDFLSYLSSFFFDYSLFFLLQIIPNLSNLCC